MENKKSCHVCCRLDGTPHPAGPDIGFDVEVDEYLKIGERKFVPVEEYEGWYDSINVLALCCACVEEIEYPFF
jgi:hypothetical protein